MQKLYISLLVVLSAVTVCFGGQQSAAEASVCGHCDDCDDIDCPWGTVEGYAYPCQCCPSCVIQEGDDCPWTGPDPPSGKVECVVDTDCCNGICTEDCDKK
ncbi:unnamed protein product [Ceutorhynchus assimilis]|uniref:Uncharacterized protein n=1 Tax=Ceutorhynchus assimilis TaxID=467358 RepID=A0A9N9MXY3_9CUCU|nr:unnamed protein product [Ceutorhynchus assimilis]